MSNCRVAGKIVGRVFAQASVDRRNTFSRKIIVASKVPKFFNVSTESLPAISPRVSQAAWHAICTDKQQRLKKEEKRNEPRMVWLLGSGT